MVNGALFFISALGAFNGLIAGIYFLLQRKEKQANFFLGGLLISISLRIGKSVLYYFDTSLLLIYLQVGLTACWFIGPFLFYYIRAEKLQVKRVPLSWKWIIGSLAVVIVGVGLIFPYQSHPMIWNRYLVHLIYLQWGIFLILSVAELRVVFFKVMQRVTLKSSSEVLPLIMLTVNLIIFLCYLWALLGHSKGVYISSAIIFSVVLYLGGLLLLHRRRHPETASPGQIKYANKRIKEDDAQLILQRLDRAMIEKGIYRNPNLKLHDLAVEINVSSHQLSQLLNDSLGKGFAVYVNEYRIEEACKILSTTDNLTIEAIGEEVGFNSKSTFFSAFKRLKGMTPAVYQQSSTRV